MTVAAKPAIWQIWLILLAGIVSVSTAAIFIRLAFDAVAKPGVGFSLVLAASRLSLASLFLIPAWRNFRTVSLPQPALAYSIASGIFLAVHFAAWITSLAYTSIVASATLVTTNPIWVALISWIWFKEKPSLITAGGIGLALLGSLVIAVGSDSASVGSNPLLGNFLALMGSWAISLYFLLGREAQKRGLSIATHVALTYTTAAILLLPLPFLFGVGYGGYPAQVYWWILLLALFPQLVGHTSFNWAVRWISPTLVTLTILAEPIGASILGMIVFHENPGWVVAGGAILILAGVILAALGATRVAADASSRHGS